MTKKNFIQRRCIRKVPRSSLVCSPKAAVVEVLSSKRSSSSSSLPASPAVEKAPSVGTSTPVVPLPKKEDQAAAPVVNLVPISLIDATLSGADLIVLSSDSEDEVDWEALAAKYEVDWEAL